MKKTQYRQEDNQRAICIYIDLRVQTWVFRCSANIAVLVNTLRFTVVETSSCRQV